MTVDAIERVATQSVFNPQDVVTASSASVSNWSASIEAGRAASREDAIAAKAIYSYLRALRALGKTRVSSADIADALDISEKSVRRIMTTMASKGVRTA